MTAHTPSGGASYTARLYAGTLSSGAQPLISRQGSARETTHMAALAPSGGASITARLCAGTLSMARPL